MANVGPLQEAVATPCTLAAARLAIWDHLETDAELRLPLRHEIGGGCGGVHGACAAVSPC